MSRRGRHGEALFSSLCQQPQAKIEAVINQSAADMHGWDHVVDLSPPVNESLPLDKQEHLIQCFVQVKTTNKKKPTTSVKLSNALKSAKARNPTFIFLFHYASASEPILYGRMIWKEEIKEALLMSRTEEAKEAPRPLHKIPVSFSFTDNDRVCAPLSDWMFEKISQIGLTEYSEVKGKLNQDLGYENGREFGQFKISPNVDLQELVRLELGYLDSIPIEEFKLYDQRFGVRSRNPVLAVETGLLSLTREGREVTVRISSENGKEANVPAVIRSPILVAPSAEAFQYRVDAGSFDILVTPAKSQHSINIYTNWSARRPLIQSLALTFISAWRAEGAISIEVIHEGEEVLSALLQNSARVRNFPFPERV